ncbi:dipeptidase [Sansalvadorimonas sp. 2012CJ34-2]|uniref:Dipeptidase n=1 Tax=Parendozoicomonas callyspongiae TaxID=2942213 RepID=A0ABT0PGG1_9GAMM|nr:dipeptidase [Sansalvadorimonas sp. 2012CJ34-2]MCL6270415.1 dipeptidase [Sansalvadorimonas sp. 2012CJ34-2]
MKKVFGPGVLLICILVLLLLWLVPPFVERSKNQVEDHGPFALSDQTVALHKTLLVADLHADSLLWSRDLRKKSTYGHVDLPRLREGNVAIQVFPAVTKSPRGMNYESNEADAPDNIKLLAMAQLWPPKTWDSILERAYYQAEKLAYLEENEPESLKIIRTRSDLKMVLAERANRGSQKVAALLAMEGAHPFEGKLTNIQNLYNVGYRMAGLQHFFDNELGGSLHGTSGEGLTAFGRAAVVLMDDMNMIIDVAHSSPQVVKDTLAITERPVIVSHTGMRGLCDTPRNISDSLMRLIANKGGLIGIGYWADASCDTSPEGIAKMIRYAVDVVGVDHVALGSDFDGAVTTGFDTSELPALTQALMFAGFKEPEIRKVMGENVRDFFLKWLPEK